MIRHDYLPRICKAAVVDDVFTNGRKIFEVNADPTDVPTMPIEFSVAAFRLGHSMIRREYNWNVEFDDGAGTLFFLFDFSGTSGFLGEGSRLPTNWIADWRRLYPFEQAALKVPAAKFNLAREIDTLLVEPAGRAAVRLVRGQEAAEGQARAPTSRSATSRARGWSSSPPARAWCSGSSPRA